MSILLIAAIIVIYSFQTLFCKLYTDNYHGDGSIASPVFSIIEGFSIVFISFAFAGFSVKFDTTMLILGSINAVILFGYNTSLIYAGERGSYAFMNVFMLFGGILVPMIWGLIFSDGNGPSPIKYAAIVAMLIACVLMNIESIKFGGAKLSYYIACGLLFIFNGFYGVLLNLQKEANPDGQQGMIMITFGFMGVIALIQLIFKQKKNTLKVFKFNKKCAISLVIAVLSAGIGVNILLVLLNLINETVLFSIDNGGVLMLSVLYSITVFKEKATPLKIIGIVLAIICIFVLSIQI